jgi:glycosyltransferase involved in cell wall biosynthesis
MPLWLANIYRRILNIWWQPVPFFHILRRYDVVMAGGAYGALLVKAIFRLKKPKWVIYDANITGTITKDNSLRRRVFKWIVARCDGIVALSQAEEDSLREMFPHLAPHIHFLYEGVDTEFFAPQAVSEENFIFAIGVDFGRDWTTLIDAVRGLPVELKIATKPSRVADNEPLPENVTAKLYTHDEVRDLYARCKVAVTPLRIPDNCNDSSGTYVVIEARSTGKPVIVTRTKALMPYVRDGEDGIFVPRGDVDALRAAITDLLDQPDKRHEMGRKGREFVLQTSEAEIYAKRLATFMEDLHNDPRTGALALKDYEARQQA